MKFMLLITLLASLHVAGQKGQSDERLKIYQHISRQHISKENYVINETITPVNKYDIDGNYKRFYQSFNQHLLICVNPIKYQSTVLDFLRLKNIYLDTSSIFQQIETSVLDSLNNYELPLRLIPFSKAPLRQSFLGNLFKKKTAISLSPVYFDERSQIALVKLQAYSKNKRSVDNPSKIIVLKKQGDEWETLGVLQETLQPTTVLQ